MKIRFSEFIELKRGCDLPTSKRVNGHYPVISANGINGHHNKFTSDTIGVITGRSGTIGEVFLSKSPYWALNTTLYVSDFKGNLPEFVYYFLKWFNLSRFASGAVVPTLNRNHLADIEVDIPNLETQLRITNILGSIDKKIEINKKKIEKLTTLSIDYFLFFEKFAQDNISSLDILIKNVIGGDWGKAEAQGIYSLKVNCIRGADIAVCKSDLCLPPERYINSKNTSKLLDKKSLIIEISGGSPTQSTGRITYIDNHVAGQFANPIICSNFCKGIQLNDDKYIYWLFLKWEYLYKKGVMFNFEGKTSGIKNFLFDIFISTYKTTILPDQFINQFNGLVEPVFNKIQNLINENNKLVKHREMIIPLLMNGQVKVM